MAQLQPDLCTTQTDTEKELPEYEDVLALVPSSCRVVATPTDVRILPGGQLQIIPQTTRIVPVEDAKGNIPMRTIQMRVPRNHLPKIVDPAWPIPLRRVNPVGNGMGESDQAKALVLKM